MIESTIQAVAETVEALANKTKSSIMENNGRAAVEYCEAMRDSAAALANLIEATEDDD
jgi:hypothetical protein